MRRSLHIISGLLLLVMVNACSTKKEPTTEKTDTVGNDTNRVNIIDNKVNPYVIVDASPMDIAYFPADYPKLKMENAIQTAPLARVIYSRPHLQGRHLFRDLLKYGEPWRLGANESTELEFYREAEIDNRRIKAGRYTLYCIPDSNSWTVVINSKIDSWGLKQDKTKDIARFTVPVQQTSNELEYFTMLFQKNETGADLLMAWDNVEARLPITFPIK